MSENKKRSISPTALVLAVVAVITAVSLTAAWFVNRMQADRSFNISNFDASLDIYFMSGGARTEADRNSDGTVAVSMDQDDDNYLGNLYVDVVYNGAGVSMLRVNCTQEWYTLTSETVTDTTDVSETVRPVMHSLIGYNLGVSDLKRYTGSDTGNQAKWYDNRSEDNCIYYASPVYNNSASPITVNLISGINSSYDISYSDSLNLGVAFEVEAVQVERFPQVWFGATESTTADNFNVDTLLPWTGADHTSQIVFS